MQHTSAAAGGVAATGAAAHHHHHHQHHHQTGAHTQHLDQGGVAPIAGTEYTSPSGNPDAAYKSHSSTTVNTTSSASGPVTDNSTLPYKPSNYTEGKPIQ